MVRARVAVSLVMLLVAAAPALARAESTGPAPTREEFVERADEICKVPYRKALRLLHRAGELAGGGEFVLAGRKMVRAARLALGVNDRLSVMDPPPADAESIAKWLERGREGFETLRDAGRALKAERPRRARRLDERARRKTRRANELVAGFGFRRCV